MAEGKTKWKIPESWKQTEVGGVQFGQVYDTLVDPAVKRLGSMLSGWSTEGTFLGDIYKGEPAAASEPEVEIKTTEAQKPEGGTTKTTTTRVTARQPKGGGKEGINREAMQRALAMALGPMPRPDLGVDVGDIKVPDVPDMSTMQRLAQKRYAPFLPSGQYGKPWMRALGSLAHVLTQNERNRQAYYGALDQNFRNDFQMNIMKEQQKRMKMQAQLGQEATIANLQRYQRSQMASQQLAEMVQRYGPQIFADQELNMGARMLAGVAGMPGAVPGIPQPGRHKPSQFDMFASEYIRTHPGEGIQEATEAFAESKRAGPATKILIDKIFPKDPVAQRQGREDARSFLTRYATDQDYRDYLAEERVPVNDIYQSILTLYPELVDEMGLRTGVAGATK